MNVQLKTMLLSMQMSTHKAIVQIMQKCSTLRLVTALPHYARHKCAPLPDTVLVWRLKARVHEVCSTDHSEQKSSYTYPRIQEQV